MKVLIIGQGGREHAMAWKIAQSNQVMNVYVAPGNAGCAQENKVENIDIPADQINKLLEFAKTNKIDLTIVGPEVPLVLGVVDLFEKNNLLILGPNKKASQLEGSKSFCKRILTEAKIPTASYKEFTDLTKAKQYLASKKPPYVIKADGLAAGKGVVIAHTSKEALDAAKTMLSGKAFGVAGKKIIIESFLQGQEASFIALVANGKIIPMVSSQDHKARDDDDKGPNTGGMGAYSPAPVVTPELHTKIINNIIKPTITTLSKHNINYNGFLYAGLMISPEENISVLEFNCRLGDPETQVILPRLESDFFELCYNAAQNKLENIKEIKWTDKTAITVVLASKDYPQTPIKDEIIKGLEKIDNRHLDPSTCKIFHAATYFDQDNNFRTNGGRVLTLTALADTLSDANKLAYSNIKNITWPSMFYRKDIGSKALDNTQADANQEHEYC